MERLKIAQLFRKSAIEKLSSPEQLDKSIVVDRAIEALPMPLFALFHCTYRDIFAAANHSDYLYVCEYDCSKRIYI